MWLPLRQSARRAERCHNSSAFEPHPALAVRRAARGIGWIAGHSALYCMRMASPEISAAMVLVSRCTDRRGAWAVLSFRGSVLTGKCREQAMADARVRSPVSRRRERYAAQARRCRAICSWWPATLAVYAAVHSNGTLCYHENGDLAEVRGGRPKPGEASAATPQRSKFSCLDPTLPIRIVFWLRYLGPNASESIRTWN